MLSGSITALVGSRFCWRVLSGCVLTLLGFIPISINGDVKLGSWGGERFV